jgi:foldase protein PrsA
MKNDQISDSVVEDSNGCYIFKMVDNNSTERYDSECENAITEKENEEFQNKIDELEVDKYLIEVNDDEWDKVTFGKTTIN